MTRLPIALLLLSGCSVPAAPDAPIAPYSQAWYDLPKCAIRIAEHVCPSGQWAEVECDRPMATLDQDCANTAGARPCQSAVPGARVCEPAQGSETVWCCR